MGRLIPCGTGARHLRNVQVVDADAELDAAARPMGIQGDYIGSDDNDIQMLDNEIGINDDDDSDN